MTHTLADVARALDARLVGDGTLPVDGAAEPAAAGPSDLALAMAPGYADGLAAGRARAALLWDGADFEALGLDGAVIVTRPRLAMAGLTALIDPGPDVAAGVHPSAVVEGAALAPGVSVGPLAVIGADAVVGAGSVIGAGATIGAGAVLGEGCVIHAGVRVARAVRLGARVIVQPGAVLGGDGFSFVTPAEHALEAMRRAPDDHDAIAARQGERQSWRRIHSLGGLELGDDVEVGANTTIDRGTVRPTVIGRGTKIDNLVQVGHNCVVGEDCLLCAHVGISGSVRVGDRVVMAGKVGVSDNVSIGDDAVLAGGTKVMSNVGRGRVMFGYPAVRMDTQVEMYKALRRLPRLMRDLAAGRGAGRGDARKAVPNPEPRD